MDKSFPRLSLEEDKSFHHNYHLSQETHSFQEQETLKEETHNNNKEELSGKCVIFCINLLILFALLWAISNTLHIYVTVICFI